MFDMLTGAPTGVVPGDLYRVLRRSPLFSHLRDDALKSLADRLSPRRVEAGEAIMQEGEQANAAFLILSGEVEIFRVTGAREIPIALRSAGDLIGEMGLLTGKERNATARARTAATVLPIPVEQFDRLLLADPEAMRALLRTTTTRLQDAEAHLVQHQKMAALGSLAAGLTHELNNPAAAVARSVEHLRSAMTDWESQSRQLGSLSLSDAEQAALDALRSELSERAEQVVSIRPLDRADLEAELADWLDRQWVDESWRLASLLVEGAWDVDSLARAIQPFRDSVRPALLWWIASGQAAHRLLFELGVGARSISDIVHAVKSYTRLDQAPVQEVDLHESIEQSLLILRHKLRGVTVHRNYAPDVPRMTVYASELNQVWTNLIDNALDALDGHGDLWIDTRYDSALSQVSIEVADSGSGIDPAVQHRLFEPFFTTKPVGKGVGLGLSISYNIVAKHRGDMQVESRPGRTRFVVVLPVNGVVQ